MRQAEKTALLKKIIENAPLVKSPDNEESVHQMRLEQTEAARIAKKVKAAKKSWTGKKRTSSRGGTLPSLDQLRYGRITAYDRTLDQQFVHHVSDSESANEMTIDQGLVSIPVPQDLLGKFGAAINSDVPQQNFPEAAVSRDENWNSYFDQMSSKSQGQPSQFKDPRN
jgi:hypothetical protein